MRDGDESAVDRFVGAVYRELHRLAAGKLALERRDHTLQATALVHEAFMRLRKDDWGNWKSGSHFFAAATEAMRRVLVDSARRKLRSKRGAGRRPRMLDNSLQIVLPDLTDLLALDEALDKLAERDASKAELVKLRFFMGMTIEEAAMVMGISRATASRYWTFSRAWLHSAVYGARPPELLP
jgi:RNA polymerase sigma factor (TIGR02999 family)